MTPDQLKSARALCDAATPGPWKAGNDWVSIPCDCAKPDCDGRIYANWCGENGLCQTDNEFIAASRALVPSLLDEVERLTKERDEARTLEAAIKLTEAACRCGSGAHPRRCVVHPKAYDHHIFMLNEEGKIYEQIETLTAERDALKAEVERLKAALATEASASEAYATARDQLRADRNEWKAECERMRPVYEAAVEWAKEGDGADDEVPLLNDLFDAVGKSIASKETPK